MPRGIFRGIFSHLLDDVDYQKLSSDARHVFLTLRLSVQVGPAAICRIYVSVLAEQTGLDIAVVEKALEELQISPSPEKPWVLREGPIVWVRNGLRHDPHMTVADPKHRLAVQRFISGLPNLPIVIKFCEYYGIVWPFKGPSKGHRRAMGGPSDKEVGSKAVAAVKQTKQLPPPTSPKSKPGPIARSIVGPDHPQPKYRSALEIMQAVEAGILSQPDGSALLRALKPRRREKNT